MKLLTIQIDSIMSVDFTIYGVMLIFDSLSIYITLHSKEIEAFRSNGVEIQDKDNLLKL